MKRLFIVIMALCFAIAAPARPLRYDPKADPEAEVRSGNLRITVLTPQMVRIEWSDSARFEDRATLAVVNRRLPVPAFKVRETSGKLTVTTDSMTLTYRKTGRPSADNLRIDYLLNGERRSWRPEQSDGANLMGTARTLDGADGSKLQSPLEEGLLSRDGWHVIDESRRHLLLPDDSRWEEWVAERPDSTCIDWYVMVYGHDYKGALRDFTRISGRIPLPPKYAFGYWWSRYWQYSDNEFVDLARMLRSLDIPIDVMIVDMDWHETWGLSSSGDARCDEYGQRIGWTGYTWQKELFPSPENFLRRIKAEGVKVALNLHPASGIQPCEEVYDRFAEAYGWDSVGRGIPFRIDERKWADAYFETVLHPMERMGVDFWWLDWQQWLESKYTKGLSNTFWLNHTFFRDREANSGTRPMIYHRWGGLGSHRYEVAFSGDTHASWATLAYLPYFTATASNVCYGYWGHDIGGHYQNYPDTDPEMYTRWMQYGVFTPIFKTHATKNRNIERRMWVFPDYFEQLRAAIRLRYTLAPYIYNAARQATDTGVSICRPMYYDWPECDEAYSRPEQFMFGDDILATCIAQPVDSVTGLAPRTIWFPECRWFDCATGTMIDGGTVATIDYTIDENPYYARAGAIIPMYPPSVRNLQEPCDELILTIIPGADGNTAYYEDDGAGSDYLDRFAVTRIECRHDGTVTRIGIGAREGEYDGMGEMRNYTLRLLAVYPPREVRIDGRPIEYDRFGGADRWSYDGYDLALEIRTGAVAADRPLNIEIVCDEYAVENADRLWGKAGIFRRCLRLTPEFKNAQGEYDSMGMLPAEYLRISQCPNFIAEYPERIAEFLDSFDRDLQPMLEQTENERRLSPDFRAKLKAWLTIRQ